MTREQVAAVQEKSATVRVTGACGSSLHVRHSTRRLRAGDAGGAPLDEPLDPGRSDEPTQPRSCFGR